jgi:hypothetical protein
MLKYWLNRLLGRPSIRFFGPGTGLLYRENGRAIRIGVEVVANGLVIDVGSIISWEDKPEEVIGEPERQRIASAAKSVLASQWGASAEVV